MNAQIWYSHSGLSSTAPAAVPTCSCTRKISNGSVCSNAQVPSLVILARYFSRSGWQYGPVRMSPSDGIGPSRTWNQMKPKMAPTAMTSIARPSRYLSS